MLGDQIDAGIVFLDASNEHLKFLDDCFFGGMHNYPHLELESTGYFLVSAIQKIEIAKQLLRQARNELEDCKSDLQGCFGDE